MNLCRRKHPVGHAQPEGVDEQEAPYQQGQHGYTPAPSAPGHDRRHVPRGQQAGACFRVKVQRHGVRAQRLFRVGGQGQRRQLLVTESVHISNVLPSRHNPAPGRRAGISFAAMPTYVVYQAEVHDPERYELYKVAAAASIAAAGGRYLVRGADAHALEGGEPPGRTVLLEFPDRATAENWYHGEQYRQARELRHGVATARMYMVDGVS